MIFLTFRIFIAHMCTYTWCLCQHAFRLLYEKYKKNTFLLFDTLIAGIGIGFFLGLISGIIPGIHANTMAGILLGFQGILLAFLGAEVVAVSMFAALITHTFLDILPSTFLGIPDPDTALCVLPAHSLCLEGRGMEAVRISALGSASAVILSLPLFVLFFLLLPSLQPLIDWGIGIVLLAVAGVLIIYADSTAWACAVFCVSGLLGVFTFHHAYLAWHPLGLSSLLMPLLSGLFGISVLLKASQGHMPEQKTPSTGIQPVSLLKHSVLGAGAGALVGWLPGLSNATANALLSLGINYDAERRGYIVATSAANTANAFLGLAALYAISRTRNGVMVALSSQPLPDPGILLIGGIGAAIIAYIATISLSRLAYLFSGLNIRWLSGGVIGLVVALSFILTGPFGLLVLVCATAIGLVPQMVNIRRVFCMGAVMIPVMLISFGISF
jgi:putative membrane protein